MRLHVVGADLHTNTELGNEDLQQQSLVQQSLYKLLYNDLYVLTYTYTCVCVCVRACVRVLYVCMYVCMHILHLQEIQQEEYPFILQKEVFVLEVAND